MHTNQNPTRIRIIIGALVLGLALALPVTAGGGGEQTADRAAAAEEEPLLLLLESRRLATRLEGSPVVDESGSRLGTVDELFVGLSSGMVSYFVVDFDALDGVPDGRYPVPVYLLYPETDSDAVMFPIGQRDVLEWAPRVEDFPRGARVTAWELEVNQFWRQSDAIVNARALQPGYRLLTPERVPGFARYTDARGADVTTGPIRGSSGLRGAPVNSRTGAALGEVADYVVSLASGRVPYAVVELVDGGMRAVPLSLFVRDIDDEPLTFQGTPSDLASAPELTGAVDLATAASLLRDAAWEDDNLEYWSRVDVSARYRYGMRLVPGLTLQAADFVGYSLVNENNQTIGTVDDLIVTRDGLVLYVEATFGGFLGLGENRVAIPVSAVEIDPYRTSVILDIPRAELSRIPVIAAGALPADDAAWDERTREYWRDRLADTAGEAAARAFSAKLDERSQAGAFRARSVRGLPVTAESGRVGTISELLVDVEEPAVAFIVVELPSADGAEPRWVPVPVQRVSYLPGRGVARIDSSLSTLRDAPAYTARGRAAIAVDQSWIARAHDYWASRNE